MDFIDLKTQYKLYKEEIDVAIQKACTNAAFIMGSEVQKVEEELASFVGARFALSCSSGTDALLLALLALDLPKGSKIITSPFTFFASAEVIAFLGYEVVFADIEEDTFNIDVNKLKELITDDVKAIIPVSLFGQPANMSEINKLATEKNIFVIEDAAQSFGAAYQGKKSGALSLLGTTSFFPAKPLGCYGDGGAVFTDDEKLADEIIKYRIHGIAGGEFTKIGLNARFDAIQATVLRIKLKYYNDEIQKREKVAAYYVNTINDLNKNYITPTIREDRSSVYAQFCVRHPKRDEVVASLKDAGIPVAIHYKTPLHLQPVFKNLPYEKGSFPVSEKVSDDIFALPMHSFLKEEDQNTIVDVLGKI